MPSSLIFDPGAQRAAELHRRRRERMDQVAAQSADVIRNNLVRIPKSKYASSLVHLGSELAPEIVRIPREHAIGKRTEEAAGWQADDTYTTSERPPLSPPKRDPSHCCVVCGDLLSHPLRLRCGHMCCYVCFRLRLRRTFKCKVYDCRRPSLRPPLPEEEVEKHWLTVYAQHYPGWIDCSQVKYDFTGFTWPDRDRSYIHSQNIRLGWDADSPDLSE
ncbi:hypothetical protein C8F01DRAFT_1260920 [Mycena amicta]|nr:hypothetical protein C8F01DRAFT_1260920 [Mycena amicta]